MVTTTSSPFLGFTYSELSSPTFPSINIIVTLPVLSSIDDFSFKKIILPILLFFVD